MTATPAMIGLSAGNRLLASSFGNTDLAPPDAHPSRQFAPAAPKLTVVAHHASASSSSSPAGHARAHAIRALRNHSAPALAPPLPLPPPPADPAPELDSEFEFESSLEAIVLLQRSMLEKQWELPFEDDISSSEDEDERLSKATVVVAVGRLGAAAADEQPPAGTWPEERHHQPGADAEPEPHLPQGHRQLGPSHAQAGHPALQEDQGRHLASAPKIKAERETGE